MSTIQKIDSESVPSVENSLNIFSLPPTTVAFNRSQVRELLPITALDNQGPYVFRIFSDNQFIDLTRTWFYLETCIEKLVGTNWVKIANTNDDKNVSVVNNFGNSFIKRLDIKINGKEVFNSGTNYAYGAYINHELFTCSETEGHYLKPLVIMRMRMRILILIIIIMTGLKIGQKGLPRVKHVIQ